MTDELQGLLDTVAAHFGLGELLHSAEAGGYANRNLAIETTRGSFIVKILREKDAAALESEALYLERVAAQGIPCPRYQAGRDGHFVLAGRNRTIALMPLLGGRTVERLSRSQIQSLGTALARLHLIDPGDLPERRSWWSPGFLSDGLAKAQQLHGAEALTALASHVESLAPLPLDHLPRSILHGDPWPGNALFKKGRLSALIDWEETTLGPSIYDLAYLALHACPEEEQVKRDLFDFLLESDQSVRPLTQDERQHFSAALRFVACSNYLWLLLKTEPEQDDLANLWATKWYQSLALHRLTLDLK